jgi:hypothetical protein
MRGSPQTITPPNPPLKLRGGEEELYLFGYWGLKFGISKEIHFI